MKETYGMLDATDFGGRKSDRALHPQEVGRWCHCDADYEH